MDGANQMVFNVVLGVASALGGWWMNNLWAAVRDLQVADKALVDKVAAMEVLVAGNYVKRDELRDALDTLFRKLDRIEAKVDRKADKPAYPAPNIAEERGNG